VLILALPLRCFAFFSPDVIFNAIDARLTGAIGAAEKRFLRLDAVTDNFAPAVRANGCQFMYRAFKTIENVTVSRRHNFKR